MTLKKRTRYSYKTSAGTFHIKISINNRWEICFENECLGSYETAQLALDDLCGGHTFSCSAGDTSALGLPDEISDWAAC